MPRGPTGVEFPWLHVHGRTRGQGVTRTRLPAVRRNRLGVPFRAVCIVTPVLTGDGTRPVHGVGCPQVTPHDRRPVMGKWAQGYWSDEDDFTVPKGKK